MSLTTRKQQPRLEEVQSKTKKLTKWDIVYIIFLSLVGGILIFYKTYDLGNVTLIITVISTSTIAFLSYLIFTQQQVKIKLEETLPKPVQSKQLMLIDKFDPNFAVIGIYSDGTSLTHADKIRFASLKELRLNRRSPEIPEGLIDRDLIELYKEKIFPYQILIQDTLTKLTQFMTSDVEYNLISEQIEINKSIINLQEERKDLQRRRYETPRGKLEKLLELYKATVELRLKQLQVKNL